VNTPKQRLFLIGLAGRAGSGKNTVAKMIQRACPSRGGRTRTLTLAFADPIKAMLSTGLAGLANAELTLDNKERPIPALGKSPRELLQTLGTEWGRGMVHPDLWVKIAMERVDHYRFHNPIIITDVRYQNEAAAIRQRGGQIWHINRPDARAVNPHSSERQELLMPGDININNNGSLDDLQAAIQWPFEQTTARFLERKF